MTTTVGITAPPPPAPLAPVAGRSSPTVEIVVPVYNEARELEGSVRTLRRYLDTHLPWPATVTIADNASTDGTWEVASRLAAQLPGVQALHLPEKGRGRALKAAWAASDAEVVAYMDVDLATDLDGILPLVAPLVSGHSDVAIGTRLARGSRVLRGPKREVISRAYNLLLRLTLHNRFTDAQCGFKALRADVARALIPLVDDDAWFFDTELLTLAEHNGLRIHEVPVDWVDDPDSRVDITATAWADLRGTWRMWRRLARGGAQAPAPLGRPPGGTAVGRVAGIGGASTVAYVALLLALRPALGMLVANAAALTAGAAGNAVAHRVLRSGMAAEEPATTRVLLWAVGLASSSVALLAVEGVTRSLAVAVATVLATGAGVSAARFVALRGRQYRCHLDAVAAGPTHRPPPASGSAPIG